MFRRSFTTRKLHPRVDLHLCRRVAFIYVHKKFHFVPSCLPTFLERLSTISRPILGCCPFSSFSWLVYWVLFQDGQPRPGRGRSRRRRYLVSRPGSVEANSRASRHCRWACVHSLWRGVSKACERTALCAHSFAPGSSIRAPWVRYNQTRTTEREPACWCRA